MINRTESSMCNLYTISNISERFGISRQAWYQRNTRSQDKAIKEDKLLSNVQEIRKSQPRIGGKKLYYMIGNESPDLLEHIGRDKFFEFLSNHNLLIQKKRSYHKTTNSNHLYKRYGNLIKDLEVINPLDVVVTDITYIPMKYGKFCYLSLVTDYASRHILGWALSNDLSYTGPYNAIKMAHKNHDIKNSIHHSDRGIQYCCHKYVNYLVSKGMRISMTVEDHVYENALAERVNGILKDEFLIDIGFNTYKEAYCAISQSIRTYNLKRPHLSLKYKTPRQFLLEYLEQGGVSCG